MLGFFCLAIFYLSFKVVLFHSSHSLFYLTFSPYLTPAFLFRPITIIFIQHAPVVAAIFAIPSMSGSSLSNLF